MHFIVICNKYTSVNQLCVHVYVRTGCLVSVFVYTYVDFRSEGGYIVYRLYEKL